VEYSSCTKCGCIFNVNSECENKCYDLQGEVKEVEKDAEEVGEIEKQLVGIGSDSDVCWAPEMDWLLSLMPDKGLIKLRDVVKYRMGEEEYFRNSECRISGGTMNYIMKCMDREMKWRRDNGVQIEY